MKPDMSETRAKIMVVEDNQMNLELARDLLEAGGFEVLSAREGNEALELARRDRPDLILMDIQLPTMDGLQVTRLLKESEDTRDIIVVALTAHAMRGDEEKARQAGCSGYIAKPINTREFVQTVSRYLAPAPDGAEGAEHGGN
jgi:two-component system cell cycle response regulator DivK